MKMSKHDEAVIRSGVRSMLNRRESAFQDFAGICGNVLGDAAKGLQVAAIYNRMKLIKYDGMRYTVKHGGFLDVDVMNRALEHG